MSKTSKKISKALKKINKQNGGQKMTAKAKKQKLNGENTMKHSFENKSFIIDGTNVKVDYQLVTPEIANDMLVNRYMDENDGDPDCCWLEVCEKIIVSGKAQDVTTPFIISTHPDDDNFFTNGLDVLTAIVNTKQPAVVAFANNIPDNCYVVTESKEKNGNIYKVLNNEVLAVKKEMEKILSELSAWEYLDSSNIESNPLASGYSFLLAPFLFQTIRDYAEKVYENQRKIKHNTFCGELAWFGVFWMLAERFKANPSFFQAIAFDRKELNPEAKKYIESTESHVDNLHRLSIGTEVYMRADKKMQLKYVFEKAYLEKQEKKAS